MAERVWEPYLTEQDKAHLAASGHSPRSGRKIRRRWRFLATGAENASIGARRCGPGSRSGVYSAT